MIANGHRVPDQYSDFMHENRSLQVAVFRRNLMEFIHSENVKKSDVMLYSMAIKDLVIYQAVFMEMLSSHATCCFLFNNHSACMSCMN